MPLLRSNESKSQDIVTKDGSIQFTSGGLLLQYQGTSILIGPNGIALSCGAVSVNLSQTQVTMISGPATLQMQTNDFTINCTGFVRINGTRVSVNNGALEVM